MTAKFGSKDVIYNTTGLIINPKIGIAYRVAKKTDIYISAGYCAQTRKKVGIVKNSNIELLNAIYSNISFNVGLTF